jgi:hypothetical protein
MENHYVVRSRSGRFVRAFVNEWQAQDWVAKKVAGSATYEVEPRNAQGGWDKVREGAR